MVQHGMSEWDGRENNFDFLRLSLAVLVIYSHAYPLGLGSNAQEPLFGLTRGQMTLGEVAVDSFFIISGFLITASAQRSRNAGSYLKKRVARIYPAFAFAMLLAALLVVPRSGAHFTYAAWPERLGNFALQTARLREFSYAGAFGHNPDAGAINGSTWSIQYEFWCYLGLALLLITRNLQRRTLLVGLLFLAWLISLVFAVEQPTVAGKMLGVIFGTPQIWARMLPLYLAGVVFYLYRDRIPLRGWIAGCCALALFAASRVPLGWTVLMPFAGSYLVLWCAFTPQLRLHRFGRFGDFSYGTYLYAYPVEQLLVERAGHPVTPLALFALATPITLLLGVASWYGVERHFLPPARVK